MRELENVIVSAVIQAKPGTVRVEHLKAKLAGKASALQEDGDLREIGRRAGRQMLRAGLVRRLEQNRGDMDEAALYFGRKKSWAYRLLKEPPSADEASHEADEANNPGMKRFMRQMLQIIRRMSRAIPRMIAICRMRCTIPPVLVQLSSFSGLQSRKAGLIGTRKTASLRNALKIRVGYPEYLLAAC